MDPALALCSVFRLVAMVQKRMRLGGECASSSQRAPPLALDMGCRRSATEPESLTPSADRLIALRRRRRNVFERLTVMFSSLGLFKKTRCPDIQNCKRTNCLFSHSQDTPAEPAALNIPIHAPKPQAQPQREQPKPTPSSSSLQTKTVPSKRTASELQTTNRTAAVEPPRKISKVGPTQKPRAIPTSTQTPVSSKMLGCCATICGDAQRVTHF